MWSKVLLIGIDGGTWSIIRPAMDGGYMPFLKNLVDDGASGILESTMPALTPAAWGAFQTGMNPGVMGVFNFAWWDKQEKKTHYVSSHSLKNTIWQSASQAGKRVALLNVPLTYPPRPINGYSVGGILTPSLESDFTYPTDFKTELLEAVPDYQIITSENAHRYCSDKKPEVFIGQMSSVIDNRAKAAQYIINKQPWDIFMVQFQASDLVQHLAWGYMDSSHSMYDQRYRDYIFDKFYGRLDRHIRDIHDLFKKQNGERFITYVVSDHGFQAHKKRFNLGNWLCREGWLCVNPRSHRTPLLKKLTQKLRLGKMLGVIISQKNVSSLEKTLKLDITPHVWEKSHAFAMGRSSEGFVYLLDEEPSKREEITKEIIAKLKQICDPETQQLIVENIYRKEDIYHGSGMEHLPDLIIEPKPGYTFTGQYQPDEDMFHEVRIETDIHIGVHHRDGIIVAAGDGIAQQKDMRANLWDMAPTILYSLGVPINENIDGQIIEGIFTEEFRKQNPILQSDSSSVEPRQTDTEYSKDDEQKIEERLKELGYM